MYNNLLSKFKDSEVAKLEESQGRIKCSYTGEEIDLGEVFIYMDLSQYSCVHDFPKFEHFIMNKCNYENYEIFLSEKGLDELKILYDESASI